MNILLILPAAEHLRISSQTTAIPKRAMLRFSILPLTLVAALTPDKHQVTLCDENVTPIDFDHDADIVGISFMTALAPRAYAIAAEFRRRGIIVVAGGYHPTLMTAETLPHFDAVVVGDAENLWPQAIRDAERGMLKHVYRHAVLPDLTNTPAPRRDLTQQSARHYATTAAVQAGRGCRHGCRYCSVTAFNDRTYRTRPIDNVLAELSHIDRDFIFVDDNIIADRDYAKRLFLGMIAMKKSWVSQCSLEIADDPELLCLARKAGCRGLFIGIETTNADNLATVGKDFNDSHGYLKRIANIRQQGIAIIAGIIVGMDGDDRRVFSETLSFLQRAGIDALQLNILTPLPGTPLYEEFKAAGRIIDCDWSHYDYRHVVIKPFKMTKQDLQNGADWLYSQFYRLDRIILRGLRTLLTVGLKPAYIAFRLNLTYRYDVIREGIRGDNPLPIVHESWTPSSLQHIRALIAEIKALALRNFADSRTW
ncbi:MAG: radical SAM protein [Kiritimatiellae bacterium]|nr:radical SAM protein [Kiritimatiellia bacterium]